ncbi:MAG: tripartite tricarboxylate transporter TctB family protein [Dehalobacterium sp.]
MARISRTAMGSLGIGFATLLYLCEAFKLPFGTIEEPQMGFMPVVVGIILLSLCIILAGKEILFTSKHIEQETNSRGEDQSKRSRLKKPLIISICLFVYPLVLIRLGFVLATVPLLFVCLRVMGYRNWLVSLLIAIVTVVVFNYIFSSWLGVFLPEGILN